MCCVNTRSVLWRKSRGIFWEEILTPSGRWTDKNTERRNNSQPDWTNCKVNFYWRDSGLLFVTWLLWLAPDGSCHHHIPCMFCVTINILIMIFPLHLIHYIPHTTLILERFLSAKIINQQQNHQQNFHKELRNTLTTVYKEGERIVDFDCVESYRLSLLSCIGRW